MYKIQMPLADDMDISDGKAKYDAQVKRVLANKVILSWILKYTMKEFADLSIGEIEQCIENDPDISQAAVNPGMTKISGSANEDAVPGEGKITYDIRFFVILPDGEHTKVLINIEAQKDSKPGYDLVSRGIFYCARMLSAQLDVEFSNRSDDIKKYDNIKKVYSIWICMDSGEKAKDSIIEYHITPNVLYDVFERKIPEHRYDLLSTVMINLGGDDLVSDNKLIRILTTLLSRQNSREKKKQLEEEYGIKMTDNLEKEVNDMCNLSDYVFENAITEGQQGMMELFNWLRETGRDDDAIAVMQPQNAELRMQLMEECRRSKE